MYTLIKTLIDTPFDTHSKPQFTPSSRTLIDTLLDIHSKPPSHQKPWNAIRALCVFLLEIRIQAPAFAFGPSLKIFFGVL